MVCVWKIRGLHAKLGNLSVTEGAGRLELMALTCDSLDDGIAVLLCDLLSFGEYALEELG